MKLSEQDLKALEKNLKSPAWRIKNLYGVKCRDSGRVVKFEPTVEQNVVIDEIYKHKSKRLIILKARQLGMSTVIDIVLADAAIWNEDTTCEIIDQTQIDAQKKLSTKVRVAFDSMPEALKQMFEIVTDSKSEFEVRLIGGKSSTVAASMKARGGTCQFMHISEWGPIQYEDAKRSEEIVTGALPAAEQGRIIIETTWKGGKLGHLWDLVDEALSVDEDFRTSADYKVLFFPWWTDEKYSIDGDPTLVSEEVNDYFDGLERVLERKFTIGQKIWYEKMKRKQKLFMFREYPSTLEECFAAPIEGAIFKEEISKLRTGGGVESFEWDRAHPVHTFWDLGSPQNTVVYYVQFIGSRIDFIDVDHQLKLETTSARVAHMRTKGYYYGFHYLPHDAMQTARTGLSFKRELENSGLTNLKVIPKTVGVWEGINQTLMGLPRCRFHKIFDKQKVDSDGKTKPSVLDAIEMYHRRKDQKTGEFLDTVVHDWSSHYADALRYVFEAMAHNMVSSSIEDIYDRSVRVIRGATKRAINIAGRVIR